MVQPDNTTSLLVNGYLTLPKGAISDVTQGTSLTTAVTTTAVSGAISMFAAINNNTSAAFTLNNVNIRTGSNVLAWSNMVSDTAIKPVTVAVSAVTEGSCTITVANTDTVNNLHAAAIVNYLIL